MIDFHERDFSHESRGGFSAFDESRLVVLSKSIVKDLSEGKINKFYLGCHLIDLWNSRSYWIYYDFLEKENRIKHGYCENCSSLVFFEYCFDKFGLDKSQTSRYMNVASEFGDGAKGFKKEFVDYSYSQLSEMLSLTPEQRKSIDPTWSIKKIREYKKELAGSVATSQRDKLPVAFCKVPESVFHCSSLSRKCIGAVHFGAATPNDFYNSFRSFFAYRNGSFRPSAGFAVDDHKLQKVMVGLLGFACDVSAALNEVKGFHEFCDFYDLASTLRHLGYIND